MGVGSRLFRPMRGRERGERGVGPHNRDATCMMKRAINTCPSWEAKTGVELQLVDGGREQGECVGGGGDLTMSVAFQKIISPSSATFPGRREGGGGGGGIRSGLFSPSVVL